MLNLLFVLSALIGPAQQPTTHLQSDEAPDKGADPELIKKAVEELEQAFKKGKTPERVIAVEKYGNVNDKEVIQWITKGLKDKDTKVQGVAIKALRWLPNPNALDALHNSLRKDKKLKKDDTLHEALVKAIGQHGSPSSIEILTDNALASVPRQVTVARIYSLGNIRDKGSVEALIDLMNRTGRLSKKKGAVQPLMKQIAVSLEVLTGEKHGNDEDAWAKWWRGSKKTFEISAKPGLLSPKVAKVWRNYWAPPKDGAEKDEGEKGRDRKKKREERESGTI